MPTDNTDAATSPVISNMRRSEKRNCQCQGRRCATEATTAAVTGLCALILFIKSPARRPLPFGRGRKRGPLSYRSSDAPCGGRLVLLQRLPTASPPGCPFGGKVPLDKVHGRCFPRERTA